MATTKFSVPNWCQSVVARAISLNPDVLAVRNEDDISICFLDYKTRKEYIVNKKTGKVIVT